MTAMLQKKHSLLTESTTCQLSSLSWCSIFLIAIAVLIGKDDSELMLSMRVILTNSLCHTCRYIQYIVGALGSALYHVSPPARQFRFWPWTATVSCCHVPPYYKQCWTSGVCDILWCNCLHCYSPLESTYTCNQEYRVLHHCIGVYVAIGDSDKFIILLLKALQILQQQLHTKYELSFTVQFVIVPFFICPVTLVILIETSCYIMHNCIREHRDSKKACFLNKFGFFL